ncbi:Gamma-glutamyltransferase [Aphelenchoides besseyi]|nr:Gamma-glutamyltransferase [Aphelenchoides besseyi]KAI6222013.1 Gamma-glutamyltransferase [Aphelenchoides besseyi]
MMLPMTSNERNGSPNVFSTSLRNLRITEENDDTEPLLGNPTTSTAPTISAPKPSFFPSKHYPIIGTVGLICIFVFILTTVFFGALYYKMIDRSQKSGWPQASRSILGDYAKAAVAADNALCSEIGRNTLLQGGNAVDAAVASLFCIGVLDVQSAGLGGGHFMTIYNATTRRCHVIDAREVAPLSATKEMFRNRWNLAQKGWLAVAVPGELHGLYTAYENFGSKKVSWRSLIEPTIQLMEEGYPTSHALANVLRVYEQQILAEPTLRSHFVNPQTNQVYKAGEQITTRNNFIETLKTLANANDPIFEFYNGTMTEKMVNEFQHNGGIITLEDFRSYRSIIRSNESTIYSNLGNGIHSCGPPPPSGAAVSMAILNLLRDVVGNSSENSADSNVEFFHRFIEASKFAYAQRSALGDIDFFPEAFGIAKNITSESWAAIIRKLITDEAHPDEYYGGHFSFRPDHGTSHISIIDQFGNAVSVTSTINLFLGAQIASEATGVVWNDEMDDFSLPGHPNFFNITPSPSNYIVPKKRPQSSMAPLVIFSDRSDEVLAIGAAGGSRIISGVAFAAHQILRFDRNVKQAIDHPRLHNQLIPNATEVEINFLPFYLNELEQRGQTFVNASEITILTAVHKFQRDSKQFVQANSDYRKGTESEPAGY